MSLRRILPLLRSIKPIKAKPIRPIKIHARPIFTTKGLIATTVIFAVGIKRPDILFGIIAMILTSFLFIYIWAVSSTVLATKKDKEESKNKN